jgi:hypothetical protein
MWYTFLKKADLDRWWREGYLNYGHSWNSLDIDPDNKKTANLPPPNENDAIWIFSNGVLSVTRAGKWHSLGNRGFNFTHDTIYEEQIDSDKNYIQGRYDAGKNTISISRSIQLTRMNELQRSYLYKLLYREFPGGRIAEL